MSRRHPPARRRPVTAALLALALAAAGCGARSRPHVLWVVWDTVRADRLALYGHDRDTTPHLARRARDARVFDCSSVSNWTVPAHASMFTGLFPREHGVATHRSLLDPAFETLAERLRAVGYETFLFAANPFVSRPYGMTQGFDVEEHPWDAGLAPRALSLVRAKVEPGDTSTRLPEKLAGEHGKWNLSASGALAGERLLAFLGRRDPERPFFAFLNYMEAHRVRVPPRAQREALMSRTDVEASYRLDLRQGRLQRVSLGLEPPLAPAERRVVQGIYDASIRELDALLEELLRGLEREGLLEDTVVVLTSDHGEHLGERDSYLHQYSLHEAVVRVPLVVWAPGRLAPGREPVPVSNIDLFPTLLELAGVPAPRRGGAQSLLRPARDRALVAEYPVAYEPLLARFERAHPEWDASRYRQPLRALRVGAHKLLSRPDAPPALYDLAADPAERSDRAGARPERVAELSARLERFVAAHPPRARAAQRQLAADEARRLEALGYALHPDPSDP